MSKASLKRQLWHNFGFAPKRIYFLKLTIQAILIGVQKKRIAIGVKNPLYTDFAIFHAAMFR